MMTSGNDQENAFYFSSKKDKWLALFIWGTIILMVSLIIFDSSVIMYIVGTLMVIFLLWIWFGTNYTIVGEILYVRSGPFKSTVHIKQINKVRATKTLLSAPALSIDRIEIHHNKYDSVIISPNDKSAFIHALLAENVQIEVDENIFLT